MHGFQLLHPQLHCVGNGLLYKVRLVATRATRVDTLCGIDHRQSTARLADARQERVGHIHQTLLREDGGTV